MAVALITGASAGIGREIAEVAAADGYDVVLVARRLDRLREAADELSRAYGIEARVEECDLSDRAQRGELFARLTGDEVEVDVLVNNAGFGSTGAFHELDRSWELDQIEVNMAALTDLTRLFLPDMLARDRGHVLNIASTAAFQPGPYMAVYYATKAYVRSFSEALWYELKETNVGVTVHCPGATRSEFSEVSGNEETVLFQKGTPAPARAVAEDAWKAAMNGERVAVHGFINWLGAALAPLTPTRLVLWAASRVNRPPT